MTKKKSDPSDSYVILDQADADLINNPHGFISSEELFAKEFKKLSEVYENSRKSEVQDIPGSRKSFLIKNGKKNKRLIKLESLFIKKTEAPFELIAKEIGLNTTITKYKPSDRKTIINLKKRFNKLSKKPWGLKLASTRGVQGISFDGLRLSPTTQGQE